MRWSISSISLTTVALAAIQACGGGSAATPQGPGVGSMAPSSSTDMASANASSMATSVAGTSAASPATQPAAAGTGGSAAASAAGTATATAGAAAPAQPAQPAGAAGAASTAASNDCGLHTKWPGDDYCIKAPPADQGFQIHIGPTNYDNPEAQYVIQPGNETNEFFPATTGNTSDVYYYARQYRMRPGSHHLILTATSGGLGGAGGKRLGGSQNLSRDNPENLVIPAEDQGIGMKLAANTPVTVNLHYINLTDQPEIKEAWINVWYRDPKQVTEVANEMYSFAPMNVPAGQHVLVHGECPIMQAGRILSHYGHRHANNLRFSTWRARGGKQDLVYEDYDWKEPLTLEYSSTVTNSAPDPVKKVGGGWSGVLDLMPGDSVIFECDIVNMTDHAFTGKNEAENDEMCILIGDTVGPTISTGCSYTTTQL